MRSVGASHIGKVRTENQDRIFFHDQPVGNLKNLYIVADGMGGHRAGGHASSFAVERFVQLIEESKQTDPIELMKSSIASVNQKMIAESQSNEEYRGMGTTFVAATISDGKVTVMNIGDIILWKSRINTDYSGSFLCGRTYSCRNHGKRGRKIPSKEECYHKSTRYRNGDTRFL